MPYGTWNVTHILDVCQAHACAGHCLRPARPRLFFGVLVRSNIFGRAARAEGCLAVVAGCRRPRLRRSTTVCPPARPGCRCVAAVVLAQVEGTNGTQRVVRCWADRGPVHEVRRMTDHDARIRQEGREGHVIALAVHAVLADRRVGVAAGNDRIGVGPVASRYVKAPLLNFIGDFGSFRN